MTRHRDDHIVVDFGSPRGPLVLSPEEQMPLVCMHCGRGYTLTLPCSISMAVAVSRQFGKEHRRCKPFGPRPRRVNRLTTPQG